MKKGPKKRTEACIQLDVSLSLHFNWLWKKEGVSFFRRVRPSAKNTKELKTAEANKAAEIGDFFLFPRPCYDSIRLILTRICDGECIDPLRLTSFVEYDIIIVEN